jgi:hypothetical protein
VLCVARYSLVGWLYMFTFADGEYGFAEVKLYSYDDVSGERK